MKPKDLVTLKRGRLNLFRYPTWGIGTYLGRGVHSSQIHIVIQQIVIIIDTLQGPPWLWEKLQRT